jgi:uncharacterized protein
MNKLIAVLFLFVGLAAHAAAPSDESIERLMSVTRMESLLDGMFTQMEPSIKAGMEAAMQGKTITPDQRKVLDIVPSKLVAAMREELNWSKLKPIYLAIYRESFEQSDIDGMLAFYATPAGRATIDKMPLVMQKAMAATQSLVRGMLPRVDAAMREALAEAGVRQE